MLFSNLSFTQQYVLGIHFKFTINIGHIERYLKKLNTYSGTHHPA